MSILDDYDLLYRVAHYFYVNGYSQVEISEMENLSRPQVSRLIAKAKELGMVKVNVVPYRDPDLVPMEQKLAELLGLDDVHIFPADDKTAASRYISAAGSWLSGELLKYRHIGLGWAQTIYRTSLRLIPGSGTSGMKFVPLLGNAGTNIPWLQANSILDRYAANFSAEAVFTQCSLFTPSAALENPLEKQRFELLQSGWDGIEAVVTGIGARPDMSRPLFSELKDTVFDQLLSQDAAGDLFGRYFDADGKPITVPSEYTLAALPLEALKDIPQVICLAADPAKAEAIRIASASGYIKTLVTDEVTAAAILGW